MSFAISPAAGGPPAPTDGRLAAETGNAPAWSRAVDGTASGTLLGVAAGAQDDTASDSFAIVVIPDTQNMIAAEDGVMVDQMTRWIVESVDDLGIRFVTHVGDVVDEADDPGEWERADAALDRLDGVVPYSVALGDHEYEVEEDMGSPTTGYLRHFGAERYASYDWYGGSSPNGRNHFQIFRAGGRDFLHLALEWEAPGPAGDPGSALGWARRVLEAHPGVPTIITTHAYLWDEEGREGRTWDESQLEGYVESADGRITRPGTTGEGIFEAVVEPYPQVFMVLSGHYHKAEGTDQGEFHQESENVAGLPVFEMLSNYQSYPNGGDGWLRVVEFVPGGGKDGLDRIAVTTYSPVLQARQTDGRSRFHFDLSFAERFGLD